MRKQKRWQFTLITVVILLTIYNILPTVLFYTKPLKNPILEKQALTIAKTAVERVNSLEEQSKNWLQSFNQLLDIKASSIELNTKNPQLIHLNFPTEKQADTFKKYLPRAGSLIPFIPAQLSLSPDDKEKESKHVTVQRNIPIHFKESNIENYFKYTRKTNQKGNIEPLYHAIILDQLIQLGTTIAGTSENSQYLDMIIHQENSSRSDEFILQLTQNINVYSKVFGETSTVAKRYYASFTQGNIEDKTSAIRSLITMTGNFRDRVKLERIAIQDKEQKQKDSGGYLDSIHQQKLDSLITKEDQLTSALQIMQRHSLAFSEGTSPWTYQKLKQDLSFSPNRDEANKNVQTILIGKSSPLINKILVDWKNENIHLELHSDIIALKKSLEKNKAKSTNVDKLDQLIYYEIARISRETGEAITPSENAFQVNINKLPNSTSLLVMDLCVIARAQAKQLIETLKNQWKPEHPDLIREAFPIWDYQTYQNLPENDKKLGLLVYAPAEFEEMPPIGFNRNSVYVIAKGIEDIYHKFNANPSSPQANAFLQDFSSLRHLLKNNNFFEYSGNTYPLSSKFSHDFFFEAEDFYSTILKATREDFIVRGTKKFATLEFTDIEQRILSVNRIETEEQEDLLKWRDEYNTVQAKPDSYAKYDIPAPTKNPLLTNLILSFKKYFRGDQRKILRWGLDLSGGKSVQIQLKDLNGKTVSDEADINQGINELYSRVNKMGVSEVNIRQEGSNITLDFPSAQGLSASDLVKASSMYFHIVNEKYGPKNELLAVATNKFLQNVWNEAFITNRKDSDSINLIAWKHLYGDTLDADFAQPMTEEAKTLYDQGLRLVHPSQSQSSSAFNDVTSKVAVLKGDSFADWNRQSHPLVIVLNNYALEGSHLTNVHAAFDPSQGNFLSFEVKSSYTSPSGQKMSPRNSLYNWTSTYSKEKIQGTAIEKLTQGEGWRMAVILNGRIITEPTIQVPLRDNVSITGSFTQREANRLESDLKAGSLSFSPHILSEKNVSPELGIKDRTMGILATIMALILVIALMVSYYRFAGFIASIAVIFNLLIMWATLQNIQATITLAGIAGIILTVGMAVDANVLVFERIREEFQSSSRIGQAIHAGYKRAFSAIIDSNITTIIAAIILLNFDSGPIKGFAITLIIGIVSSMFSALFMTKYFFYHWLKNSKNTTLKMANLIKKTRFNFFKYTKISFASVVIVALAGGYFLSQERHSILGMDFTGGYSLSLEVEGSQDQNIRNQVENALVSAGLTKQSFQVKELASLSQIKILLAESLDHQGNPFYRMPLETHDKNISSSYQNNPRLVFVVNALEKAGLKLTPLSLKQLETNWTSISGQISDTMRNNALIGLSLALLCILIYITLRFEFKYAISATLCLAIDVFITIAILSIMHRCGVPVQIDLNTIAALMTIIGYSLNDTIIIFDRIREDLKQIKRKSFKEIVNQALNLTLSRTLMTSGTTLVVLIALLALGGSAVFGLALVMVIGVVFGTLSSLFIAAPLLLFFNNKEQSQKEKLKLRNS